MWEYNPRHNFLPPERKVRPPISPREVIAPEEGGIKEAPADLCQIFTGLSYAALDWSSVDLI